MTLHLIALLVVCGADPAEDLSCLKAELRPESASILYQHLQQEAYAALDRRRKEFESLKTPEQIRDYQQRLRTFFVRQLGGFPDRTPLNAQTVGTISADGYRIEKVIFESQPRHHVTANLYWPAGQPPFPAVLVSSGHSRTAKTADYNQRFGIALAQNGMAALCFDPIGQGERSQILTDHGRPKFSSTTQEHSLIGVGSILVGSNTARYRIWDAMRAIDYLESRTEIDAKRIGMTGCSGGGTLTSYVMALDDRIACAAPACYLTTFRKLIETIGPQDAEQNIFGQLSYGLDHPDYVLMRAPRPTLISATTGDYFDVQGTWDTYRQAKRTYTRLGSPERVDMVEAEGTHGVHPANLAAIVQWMRRWLVGKDEPVQLASLNVRPESELLCTEKGQVLLLPGERSVFDLNAEWEKRLLDERQKVWQRASTNEVHSAIRNTVGVRRLNEMPPATRDKAGRVQRDGYHIDKLVLKTDSGVPLPALTYHPAEPDEDAYLYVHERGKVADGAPGGPIEKLVHDGYVVVSVDLRGQGETGPKTSDAKTESSAVDGKSFYVAYLLGKSYVGMRTEDVMLAGQFVAHYQTEKDKPRRVHLVGVGQAAIPALHAAALEPRLFASVTLRDMPRDWTSLVGRSDPGGIFTSTVHGVLRVYDLPDLVRMIQPDKLKIE